MNDFLVHFDENLDVTDEGDGTVSVDGVDTRVTIQRGDIVVEDTSRLGLSGDFLVIRDGLDAVMVQSNYWMRGTVGDDLVLGAQADRVEMTSASISNVGASVFLSSREEIDNTTGGTITRTVPLDSVTFDDLESFDGTGHSFVAQEGGTYEVMGTLELFRADSGSVSLDIHVNGRARAVATDGLSPGKRSISISKLLKLSPGDAVSLAVTLAGAVTALTITGGELHSHLSIQKAG